MPNRDEDIRSEEVQELMTEIPHWVIRWGITAVFMTLIVLIFISWLIKYPDTIAGEAIISTEHPPITLIAKESGEINDLLVPDLSQVEAREVIASLGNSFTIETRTYLEQVCTDIEKALYNEDIQIQFADQGMHFGTIQLGYNELKSSVQEFENFLLTDPTSFELSIVKEQIENHKLLGSVNDKQLATAKKQLANAQKKYITDKLLFEKGIISEIQLFDEEKKLIQVESNLGNQEKTVVQNTILITGLQKQLNTLTTTQNQKKAGYLVKIQRNLSVIRNAIDQWGQTFLVTAPTNGELNYLGTYHKHDYVQSSTEMFAVVPSDQNFIGYLDVPKSGYGKIKTGQKVRISIDNYPYQEYGRLEGEVTKIAQLPKEGLYRVTFELTNGMESSYGKTFLYTPEMSGSAEIITDDVRLFTRIFNKVRKMIN